MSPVERTPDRWTGRLVAVTLAIRNPDEFVGRLDEANELGVALTLSPSNREVATFYPWVAIRRLRLIEENEEPRPGPVQRVPGDPGWFS